VAAARQGAAAELAAVVDAARSQWPRDTGASSRQLATQPTDDGAALRLTGYAPYVRRSGSRVEAWRELIADRVSAVRAGRRILGVFGG